MSTSPHLQIWPCLQLYMLQDVLLWLPLQHRIPLRIIALVWRSLLSFAPNCLRDLCCTTLTVPGRHLLRSTEQGVLIVLFVCITTKQNRAFSVVCPSLWNG